ncbi:MAG: DUF3572 domain-containing protein [Kordiimonadaceae bacterium]|nr:DUF3572 domain-containing protein [Kordiimonadaceae bacterium]MBO6569872.1 DUF3572 domain-containing protein [Kordiimonadaceae bacterium]MBO6966032.1 DUF3572 domain-containing protein [Kordiimonadaceae bacterium]
MSTDHNEIIALQAVGYILQQDTLRDRFMALSGVDVDDLRSSLGEPSTLASILEFLINNEPDLLDTADALDVKPEAIVAAWRALGGGEGQEW